MYRVLIVEDEVMLAMDLEDIVIGAGHEVIGIVHDRKGVSRICSQPQVALVDLNLRDGPTGRDIARELTDDAGTKVIFVTANPGQIGDPPPAGAVGYVQKPFSAAAISAAISYAATGAGQAPPGLHVFGASIH